MKFTKKQKMTPVSQVKSLVLSLFDTKASKKNKMMVAAILLYILSPIDFIPDFIPLVGYADDVILPILLLVANHLLTENNEPQETHTRKEAEKIY